METPHCASRGDIPPEEYAPRARPSVAKRIFFSLVYMLFLLAVFECILSLISHLYYPRLTVSDKDLGWKFTPTGKRIRKEKSRPHLTPTRDMAVSPRARSCTWAIDRPHLLLPRPAMDSRVPPTRWAHGSRRQRMRRWAPPPAGRLPAPDGTAV